MYFFFTDNIFTYGTDENIDRQTSHATFELTLSVLSVGKTHAFLKRENREL